MYNLNNLKNFFWQEWNNGPWANTSSGPSFRPGLQDLTSQVTPSPALQVYKWRKIILIDVEMTLFSSLVVMVHIIIIASYYRMNVIYIRPCRGIWYKALWSTLHSPHGSYVSYRANEGRYLEGNNGEINIGPWLVLVCVRGPLNRKQQL